MPVTVFLQHLRHRLVNTKNERERVVLSRLNRVVKRLFLLKEQRSSRKKDNDEDGEHQTENLNTKNAISSILKKGIEFVSDAARSFLSK